MPTLKPPAPGLDWELTYRPSPRAKRAFHTPLDANHLIDASKTSAVRLTATDTLVTVSQTHPLKQGTIAEVLECDVARGRMRAGSLTRTVTDASGTKVREEVVDFRSRVIPLPDDAYPEVMTPFLLCHQPWSGDRETIYTWMNDRFVARVHAEGKHTTLKANGRKRGAIAVQMYPDFNDWVPLGGMLTKLTKPFLPRYYMWFDPQSRKVIRFEGPYGPPGAPELVLDLVD